MRILRRDPAEIFPHAGYYVGDLGFRKLGHGAGDVEPGAFGNAEPRADRACQRTADCGGPIERQQSEGAKAQRRSPALHSVHELNPSTAR